MTWLVMLGVGSAWASPPAVVKEATREVDQALRAIGATPDQRAELQQIAGEALRDAASAVPDARRLASELLAQWSAPTLDPSDLEESREHAVELVDRTSGLLLPHAIDAAEVLTPAQRKALAARVGAELARLAPTS